LAAIIALLALCVTSPGRTGDSWFGRQSTRVTHSKFASDYS
jgi:hypothetical protein